ncbi:MAG: hypothetical protein HY658_07360 [Actinobacteria bacterium]|nr:hypothetical protein [Actinomycetota bacterium]
MGQGGTEPIPAAGSEPGGHGVAVLLAAAAVVAAFLGARASLVSSAASGDWQHAVRQETKRAAALVEDVRFVYSDEASAAFLVAESEILAEEYRRQAEALSGTARAALVIEARVQEALAAAVGGNFEIVTDPSYRTAEGGFDVGARLAAVRAAYPDLVAIDPDEPMDAADAAARRAVLGVGATLPVAAAFLFGALAQGFPGRRRPLLSAGFAFLALGALAGVLIEAVA